MAKELNNLNWIEALLPKGFIQSEKIDTRKPRMFGEDPVEVVIKSADLLRLYGDVESGILALQKE